MNIDQIAELLINNGVDFDPTHEKRILDTALELGFIGLKLIGFEHSGIYEPEDVPIMRRQGYVLAPVAFGVNIYEAVPFEELEV